MLPDVISRFLTERGFGRSHLLLACSGGFDSTAMLLAMSGIDGIRISVGHVNHHLRGEESDDDASFIRALCEQLSLPFQEADGSLSPTDIHHHGIEGAARAVRYRLLESMRQEAGADLIATAHQKNDQAETVMMRILASSGVAGMRGIHEVRKDNVVRPMLEATRVDVEDQLASSGVAARRDSSNLESRFLRNRVRRVLNTLDDDSIDSLAAIGIQATALWPAIEHLLATIPIQRRGHESRFLFWPEDEWLRRMLLRAEIDRLDFAGSRNVSSTDLSRLASHGKTPGRVSVTERLELTRRDDQVALELRREAAASIDEPLPLDGGVDFPHAGRVSIRLAEIGSLASIRAVSGRLRYFQLPSASDPRFRLRTRLPGDRFQPLGMSQDKKLTDFLIDRKIPASLRDRIPLLVHDGVIVALPGIEVSERFKVQGSREDVYEVRLEPDDY